MEARCSLKTTVSSEATISWESLEKCVGRVEYREEQGMHLQTAVEAEPHTVHSITLTKLKEHTGYVYAVGCGSSSSQAGTQGQAADKANSDTLEYRFETMSRNGPKKFVVVADTQTNTDANSHLPLVVNAIKKYAPNYMSMIIAGDIAQNCDSQSMWNLFFQLTQEVRRSKTLFTIPGNHDGNYAVPNECLYPRYLQPTVEAQGSLRSFHHVADYGNVIVIGLSDRDEISPASWKVQIGWLEQTLEQYASVPIKIVVVHRPYFRAEYQEYSQEEMNVLMELFVRYRLTLLICGHQHLYRRYAIQHQSSGHNFVSLCVGGGGGSLERLMYWQDQQKWGCEAVLQAQAPVPSFALMQIENNTVHIRTLSLSGSLIDELELAVAQDGTVKYTAGLRPTHNTTTVVSTPYVLPVVASWPMIVLGLLFIVFACIFPQAKHELILATRTYVCTLWTSRPQQDLKVELGDSVPSPKMLHERLLPSFPAAGIPARRSLYLALLLRVITSAVALYYTLVFALSFYTLIGVTFRRVYGDGNYSIYASEMFLSSLCSLYVWLLVYWLDGCKVRLLYNGLVLLFFLSLQLFAHSTLYIFEDNYSVYVAIATLQVCGLVFEVVLAAVVYEMSYRTANPHTVCQTANPFFWTIDEEPGKSKCKQVLMSMKTFCIVASIATVEQLLSWIGLSYSFFFFWLAH